MGPHCAHRLRYRLAFDHALCRAIVGVFVRTVLGAYRRRARRHGLRHGQGGCVTVIQRFGSGLELNIHFHTLALDGVFSAAADGTLRFHPVGNGRRGAIATAAVARDTTLAATIVLVDMRMVSTRP